LKLTFVALIALDTFVSLFTFYAFVTLVPLVAFVTVVVLVSSTWSRCWCRRWNWCGHG
jgi:hypothetical protein